jgi:hypothetical protein
VNSANITEVLDLIHAIQISTKTDPCFNLDCNQSESCLWKAECKKLIAKWQSQ